MLLVTQQAEWQSLLMSSLGLSDSLQTSLVKGKIDCLLLGQGKAKGSGPGTSEETK